MSSIASLIQSFSGRIPSWAAVIWIVWAVARLWSTIQGAGGIEKAEQMTRMSHSSYWLFERRLLGPDEVEAGRTAA